MSRDFAFLATPATARRLLLLQRFGLIDLPDGMTELAARDCIDASDFDEFVCPYTEERATITQFLLDNNLRGILQARYHPSFDELSVLNTLRLAQPSKITILTRRASAWRRYSRTWFLDDVEVLAPYDLTGAWIDERRDGPLVIDLCMQMTEGFELRGVRFLREFCQVILYQSCQLSLEQLTHWTVLAAMMFPTMPNPLSIGLIKNNPAHWATMQLHDFAHFYNVCLFPQYITSDKLLNSLTSYRIIPCSTLSEYHKVSV